jgi:hypothetical protein
MGAALLLTVPLRSKSACWGGGKRRSPPRKLTKRLDGTQRPRGQSNPFAAIRRRQA